MIEQPGEAPELQPCSCGRHFGHVPGCRVASPDLAAIRAEWLDESQSVLLRSDYRTVIRRLFEEIDALAERLARAGPCQCDPPGSGEEYCNGVCELKADLAAARETIEQTRLDAEVAQGILDRRRELLAEVDQARAEAAEQRGRAERFETALMDTLRRWSEMSQCSPNPVVVMHLAKGEVGRIVAALAQSEPAS